jgi:hypothetical protein
MQSMINSIVVESAAVGVGRRQVLPMYMKRSVCLACKPIGVCLKHA